MWILRHPTPSSHVKPKQSTNLPQKNSIVILHYWMVKIRRVQVLSLGLVSQNINENASLRAVPVNRKAIKGAPGSTAWSLE